MPVGLQLSQFFMTRPEQVMELARRSLMRSPRQTPVSLSCAWLALQHSDAIFTHIRSIMYVAEYLSSHITVQ